MMHLVTASNLQLWSNSLAARADLPSVVASLIRASCPRLDSYRFPSGDASQTHGFDGVAEVADGGSFVPLGRSVWEFGTGKDYASKATKDYKKRTDQLSKPEREKQSFVFVTSRIWDTGLDEWERERQADGWQKVRILDANGLELWLAEHPAVAIPLARQLGIIPPSGVRTVQDFWDEYRLNFKPAVVKELLLSGRTPQANRLCEGLSAGLPNLGKWQADSATEATAFIVAAIMDAEPELSQFLCSKTLILETVDAAHIVPTTNRFNFILPPVASRVGPVLARTNQVILVLGSDDRVSDAEVLERMNTRDFAAGLKAMGEDEEEAFRLASTCGRSLTALSRLRPSGHIALPAWRDDLKLIPILLAGAWDASNEHDRKVIAQLCDTTYEHVDIEARRFMAQQDAPVDLEGTVWSLRSSVDAFTVMGHLIDSGSQDRFRTACIEVFSERDRTLDIPAEQRPIIPTRGEGYRHSEWLRHGLAKTLILIAGLHEAAKFKVIGSTAESYIDGIVSSIPFLASDAGVIASLKAELPRIAEAAPHPLASALERVLEGESALWAPVIFRDTKNQSFFGSFSPHTYVLWALETLAWSPIYLYRATSLLMTLAEFDPGGSTGNRPLRSLREIFLAWRPNTNAALEDRIAVLRSICQMRPRAGLRLAMSLLPSNHDHSVGTAKPRLRDFGDATSKITTVGDAQYAFQKYAEVAVELAASDISRLTELIDSLPQLDVAARARAIDAIEMSAQTASADDTFKIWSKLHNLVRKHRYFREAAWALKADELKPLEDLCNKIQPADPVKQILWLFDDYVPKTRPLAGEDHLAEANRDRSKALRDLLQDRGLGAVLSLAGAAKLPFFVGIALAEAAPDIATLQEAVSRSYEQEGKLDVDFAMALSARAHEIFQEEWDVWVAQFARKLDPRSAVTLFLRWSDSRATWIFVESLGQEVSREYWKSKYAFRPSSQDDLLFAFARYCEVGRFSAILDMIAYQESLLTSSQCVAVLQGLIVEVNQNPPTLQRVVYEVVHMIENLQQRQDVELAELARLEYQYLPLLEFRAEPKSLNRLLGSSPELFVGILCDVFMPSSGEKEEITEDRRSRARLGYQVLQSIKSVPGISSVSQDAAQLRNWIADVRNLAQAADRAVIADQQIGQILAYAPTDPKDGVWPIAVVRELIEDLSSEEIERGIAISRFNQRGVFTKDPFEGGKAERALSVKYRDWADRTRQWPRTSSLLRLIADDWDYHGKLSDTQVELNQLWDR